MKQAAEQQSGKKGAEDPKAKAANGAAEDEPAELDDDFDVGDDYQELGGGEFHPWVDKQAMIGKPFIAVLKGRFQKQGKRSKGGFGFTLRLERVPKGGIPCITSDPETRKPVKLVCRPGQMVSLDHTKALDDLQDLLDSGGVYRVYFKIKEVQTLESGNTFYKWITKAKCVKAPPKPVEREDEPPF